MNTRTYDMTKRAETSEDTRLRIVHGARVLFAKLWYDEMTLAGIAREAGVSHQTVLNHFGSKDGVIAAVTDQIDAEIAEREAEPDPGDTEAAIRILLDRYEEIGLENVRLVVQEHRAPALHASLEKARAHHRVWVETAFAHSLPQRGAERTRKIAALLAVTEVMAWKAIRHDYGFSREETFAALASAIRVIEGQS